MSEKAPEQAFATLLAAWRQGRREAADELFSLLYEELGGLASRQIARGDGDRLEPTDVVHETYLKLVARAGLRCSDRRHFLALSSRVMRQVLVDHARRRRAGKRGGGRLRIDLEQVAESGGRDAEVLALEEALANLEAIDVDLVRLVELRFFAGLSLAELAATLGVSESTVKRDWQRARSYLQEALGSRRR